VRVVRRADRVGFKAGNLNNYLRTATYDYFVILDSDEIIPADYIERSLDYFAYYDNAGIVQANHSATRNRNNFMRMFAIGVDSHWIAYQTVKNRHGFLSLLGHGAMVSRTCYDAAGGFPNVVAEDLCFSIAARDAGYYTVFAPDIRCEEEFPVNYHAFRKRHSKWTQGNMEFIKRYTGAILRSRMSWFEKMDIYLFTYSLPLTALFSLYVAIHVIVLPALGYRVVYPLWMLAPTVAFLLAPMLNDVLFHYRRISRTALLSYLLHSIVLYGSMFFISLRSSVTSAFGKSVFVVTPKGDESTSVRQALRATRSEIIFGCVLAAVSLYLTSSVLPVALIVCPALFCFFLALKHNQPSARPLLRAARPLNRPELPAAVILPARTAAEERDQLVMLAARGPERGSVTLHPAFVGRRDRALAGASQT
jgi:cellulose synthase/poly-beta-1,6-N-acetylglucosamine synthase-like glycosyltransferase